jgi:hypothetical protein
MREIKLWALEPGGVKRMKATSVDAVHDTDFSVPYKEEIFE